MEFAIKNKHKDIFESFSFSGVSIIQTDGESTIDLLAKLEDNKYTKYSSILCGNRLTKIDLPSNVIVKLVSPLPFSYTVPDHTYFNKKKIKNFLYEIDYGNIDYKNAYHFFETENFESQEGACSSVRNGKFYGRNLDWLYDNNVDFVVHTPKLDNRYAVLGIAGNAPKITAENVEQTKIEYHGYDMFKLLPFFLLDGINEMGVFVNSNVCALRNGETPIDEYIIEASLEEKKKMCSKMIPRFILDNFSSALTAIKYIRDYVTVFFPKSLLEMNYQIHYMVGDSTGTYALEFIDGKVVFTKVNQLTNFNVGDVNFNYNGKVYTPEDVERTGRNQPTLVNNIEKYGAGLERWNLIVDNYITSNTKEGMRGLLQKLYYSRTYQGTKKEPFTFWHSEYSHGKNDLWIEDGMPESDDTKYLVTVDSKPSEYAKVEEIAGKLFADKVRGETSTWITVHSCVYDLDKKVLYVRTQEEETEYMFKL